jgi:hypothetical protein
LETHACGVGRQEPRRHLADGSSLTPDLMPCLCSAAPATLHDGRISRETGRGASTATRCAGLADLAPRRPISASPRRCVEGWRRLHATRERRQMPEQTQSRLGPPGSGYDAPPCASGPAHGVRTAPVFLRQLPPGRGPDSVRFSSRRCSPLRSNSRPRRIGRELQLRCVPLWSLKPAETGTEMLADSPRSARSCARIRQRPRR